MEAEAEEEAAVVVMVGKKKGEEEVSGYLKGREGEGRRGWWGRLAHMGKMRGVVMGMGQTKWGDFSSKISPLFFFFLRFLLIFFS